MRRPRGRQSAASQITFREFVWISAKPVTASGHREPAPAPEAFSPVIEVAGDMFALCLHAMKIAAVIGAPADTTLRHNLPDDYFSYRSALVPLSRWSGLTPA